MADSDVKQLSDIFQEILTLDEPEQADDPQRYLRSSTAHARLAPSHETQTKPEPPSPPRRSPLTQLTTVPTTAFTTVPTTALTTVPTTALTTVTTNSLTSVPVPHSTMAPPIKILPTTASVRPFSGADLDYSAREFIGQCEAVMRNASVTEPGDKIAFVKSNLQPGSMACKLIQSSMF